MSEYLIAQTNSTYIAECLNAAGAVVDLSSGVTTQEIIFTFPDATTETKTSSFTTDGSDGKIQVALTSSDLTLARAGYWKATVHVVQSGNVLRSLPVLFLVKATEDGV